MNVKTAVPNSPNLESASDLRIPIRRFEADPGTSVKVETFTILPKPHHDDKSNGSA